MNTKKYLKYSILPLALMLGGLAFTACTDDIEGGKPVDEGAYDAVKRVDGMLLDVTSNKNESVIELRSDKHQTEVFFRLTKVPQKGVDVKIEMDPAYLETYNAEHGTEFELFPAANVAIDREGKLLLAPGEIRLVPLSGWAFPWPQAANCRRGRPICFRSRQPPRPRVSRSRKRRSMRSIW